MRAAVIATAICFSVAGFSASPGSEAAIRRSTDIPAQALGPALQTFANEREFHLLYRTEFVGRLRTGGATGELTPDEALVRLLHGTGLSFRFLDERTVTIFPLAAQTQQSEQSAAPSSPSTAPAAAESEPTAGAREPLDTRALEEVIVTAQRREESLQDVPISISVYSGATIEANRIETLQDYLELTPNVSFQNNGTPTSYDIGIRGVSNIGGASNVFGVYVDEFNVAPGSANTTFDQRLLDVERLEVLRGPQGTFFGRNVSGGAINITTRKPQPEFEATVLAEVANYDSYVLRGSVNTPLSDRLFARFSGYGESFGGFLKNDGVSNASNDREQYGGRIMLRYLPSERLTADLAVSYSRLEQGFPNFVPSGTLNDLLGGFGLEPVPVAAGFFPDNTRHIETDMGLRDEADTLIATGRLEFAAEDFSIVSITGFIDSDTSQAGEGDHSPLTFWFDEGYNDMESWSTELRAQSNLQGSWQWMVGAIYARDEIQTYFNRSFGPAWFFGLIGLPLDFPIPPRVSPSNDFSTDDITSYGAFGELSWTGLDERLKLSLSGRWQRDEIDQSVFAARRAPFPPFGETIDDFAGSASFSSCMPRLAVTYKLSPHLTTYAVASKGVKPGGYNLGTEEVPGSPTTFEEEELWNYEIGLKGELLERRLRYSLAAFHMDWDQIQVGQFYVDPVTVSGVNLTINGTSAKSSGVELEFTAVPTERLQFSAGIGYNDATFDDFPNAIVSITGDTADVTGNLLPLSTRWTANAAAGYRQPIGSAGDGFARIEYVYRGDTYDDLDNRDIEGDLIPAYDLWNLRLGFEGQRYSLIAFLDNLTDEDYVSGWLATSSMTGAMAVVNPRMFGVRVIARWE